MISTDYQRTEETLNYYLYGLYTLDESNPIQLKYELDYNEQLFSPLSGTIYEKMLEFTHYFKCPNSPIIRIPIYIDNVMSVRTCKILIRFLAWDEFDMQRVEEEIRRDISYSYLFTKELIETIFNTIVHNVREYFDLSDDLISLYGDYKQSNNYNEVYN